MGAVDAVCRAESQVKYAIFVWIDVLEHTLIGDIRSESVEADVECSEEHLAIDTDVEETGFGIILRRGYEKQVQFIGTGCKGDIVGKVACAPVVKQHRVTGFYHLSLGAAKGSAAYKIPIRLPVIARAIYSRGPLVSGEQSYRNTSGIGGGGRLARVRHRCTRCSEQIGGTSPRKESHSAEA